MGEGWGGDDVADGVDVCFTSAHERIDLYEAALDHDLRPFEAAVLGDRAPARGGEDDLDVKGLLLSFRADDDLHAALADVGRLNFGVGQDFDSLFLEEACELFRYLLVFDRQKHRQHFDDRHLRTEAGEDRGEFAADGACSDDQHRLRHLADLQNVIGVDDALAVGLDMRQVARDGAHGQDDVLRVDALRAGLATDLDHTRSGQFAEAGDALDLVLFEEELDAFGARVDDALLARLHHAPVERDVADGDAELLRFLDLGPDVGVL